MIVELRDLARAPSMRGPAPHPEHQHGERALQAPPPEPIPLSATRTPPPPFVGLPWLREVMTREGGASALRKVMLWRWMMMGCVGCAA
eukprot:1981516-Rhodomonas_salina.2